MYLGKAIFLRRVLIGALFETDTEWKGIMKTWNVLLAETGVRSDLAESLERILRSAGAGNHFQLTRLLVKPPDANPPELPTPLCPSPDVVLLASPPGGLGTADFVESLRSQFG